jgi:hypothetical protein
MSQVTGMSRCTTIVVVGLALTPLVLGAQSIQTDWDRSFDFSTLKTYNYVSQPRGRNDPLVINPMNERRIRVALDSQLTARGYARDSVNPDFLVAYHVATRSRLEVQDWGYGPGRWGNRRIDVDRYVEGTLIVDIVSAASKELVWRGFATGTIRPRDADKKIRESVEKLMKQYSKDIRPRN